MASKEPFSIQDIILFFYTNSLIYISNMLI